jgi:hypothetical protein
MYTIKTPEKKDNERLKILVDALVQLSKTWIDVGVGDAKHSIYAQIDFLRKKISEELRK